MLQAAHAKLVESIASGRLRPGAKSSKRTRAAQTGDRSEIDFVELGPRNYQKRIKVGEEEEGEEDEDGGEDNGADKEAQQPLEG